MVRTLASSSPYVSPSLGFSQTPIPPKPPPPPLLLHFKSPQQLAFGDPPIVHSSPTGLHCSNWEKFTFKSYLVIDCLLQDYSGVILFTQSLAYRQNFTGKVYNILMAKLRPLFTAFRPKQRQLTRDQCSSSWWSLCSAAAFCYSKKNQTNASCSNSNDNIGRQYNLQTFVPCYQTISQHYDCLSWTLFLLLNSVCLWPCYDHIKKLPRWKAFLTTTSLAKSMKLIRNVFFSILYFKGKSYLLWWWWW